MKSAESRNKRYKSPRRWPTANKLSSKPRALYTVTHTHINHTHPTHTLKISKCKMKDWRGMGMLWGNKWTSGLVVPSTKPEKKESNLQRRSKW